MLVTVTPSRFAAIVAGLAVLLSACAGRRSDAPAPALDRAAESYVRLVLALGERDADSLDSYHGPPAWQMEARARRAALVDIQSAARSLAESLASSTAAGDEPRQLFLVRQLQAVVTRIDILRGRRPPFAEETRALFGVDVRDEDDAAVASARAELDRLLPGRGDLTARYAVFDRRFLIASDRLGAVLARAIQGCREATRAHVSLPAAERVDVEYVGDLPWSAFTRYEGGFKSRVQVNAALPLSVDRALDLACHEAYPGHHTIDSLLEARFGSTRVEFLVQPLFSPQSLLHEAASSLAGVLAFSESERVTFEREQLFPLAGLDQADADRYVRVGRLVDRLHGVHGSIARRYLDGVLDFPRAALALERDALVPSPRSADVTLKFLNRYRTYAATYTVGRDAAARYLDLRATRGDTAGRWRAYIELVTDPAQIVPPEPARK
jgi:hypothetical protein